MLLPPRPGAPPTGACTTRPADQNSRGHQRSGAWPSIPWSRRGAAARRAPGSPPRRPSGSCEGAASGPLPSPGASTARSTGQVLGPSWPGRGGPAHHGAASSPPAVGRGRGCPGRGRLPLGHATQAGARQQRGLPLCSRCAGPPPPGQLPAQSGSGPEPTATARAPPDVPAAPIPATALPAPPMPLPPGKRREARRRRLPPRPRPIRPWAARPTSIWLSGTVTSSSSGKGPWTAA